MKVRHFGLQKTPVAPGSPGASGAVAGEGIAAQKQATGANPAKGDVTLEGGALRFPRGEELAENAKIDRARTLLQTLRAEGGDAFGGRVKGGVDVAATLRSYFRALEVAPLALAAGADAAVSDYVQSLDVPDDVRPLVALAAGDVPAAGPLGTNASYERDRTSDRFWNDWTRASDPNALGVSDATIKAFFGRWGFTNDLYGVVRHGDARFQQGVFKLFARAKELGLDVTARHAPSYSNGLPPTANSAAVLVRFANAFGIDPRTLSLADKPLPQWQSHKLGAPLGDVAAWEQDSAGWYAAVEQGDARALRVNDRTLETLLVDGYTDLSYWLRGPSATHKAGLEGFARLAALGVVETSSIENACSALTGSAEVARALDRVGKACGVSVQHIALGGKTVGEWLSGRARASGGSKRALGDVRTWEQERNYNGVYNTVRQDPRAAMKISDATLQKWFGAWGPGTNLPDYAWDGVPETRVAYALWWARGKELGLGAELNGDLTDFAASMPATAEAAQALRRLGRAFGVSVEQLSVGDKRVSSFPRAKSADAEPELPARAPLGDTKMLKADLQAALRTADPALFSVDDASLKRLLAFDPELTATMGASRDRAWRLGVLTLADRALALGAIGGAEVQGLVQSLPQALCEDASVSALVATLVVKARLSASALTFSDGASLTDSAETHAHVMRLERALEGVNAELLPRRGGALKVASGPLGDRPGPHHGYWNRRDPGIFALSDAAIRSEMLTWGDMSWLSHWQNHEGVLSLVARIIELNEADGQRNCNAKANVRQWLADVVPEQMCTAAALPHLLRLCKAAGVAPKDVVIEHKRGTVALSKHPELVKLGANDRVSAEARQQQLAQDLALLAPNAKTRGTNGGPAHPAEREAAVLHLLGVTNTDAPVLHELDELLATALPAMQAGALERVDLARVPAKHRDALLFTAFAPHDHPAAMALLAGVFFKADAASIERAMVAHGQLPKVAHEMGALAEQLSKASASELAFCALGLGADPPELASLPLRAWMLTKPEPAAVAQKLKAEPDNAAALCAMVLEQATLKDTPVARRAALVEIVKGAEQQGLVERDAMVALLSDAAKRALDADAIATVQAAAIALVGANGADAAQAARAQLATALAQPTWTQDPNVLATAALEAAAEVDARFTASLGAVDQKGGGVAGKPWESRLANKAPRVEVAGVKLAIETPSGRAPRVGALAYPLIEDTVGEKALQLVATRWLAQRPFSIDDVDGASALHALAQLTGARLTDIAVTRGMTLDALLGPDGAISKALADGGVAHIALVGDAWPAGLFDALRAAHGDNARVIATGAPLPGAPTLKLPPLDEEVLSEHAMTHGMVSDAASTLASVVVSLRDRIGGDVPLRVIERVAARMQLIDDDDSYVNLQRAIASVVGATPGLMHAPKLQADLTAVLRNSIGASEDDAELSLMRRTARLGDVPFKVVEAGLKLADMPALSDGERLELRPVAWALEVKEPVIGDARHIERLGVAYGTMTGRDVHVHLLHANSKPSDVLSKSVGDVVIVAHRFADAPAAVQSALLDAAREGRIRLLVEDAPGVYVADGFALSAAAGGAGAASSAKPDLAAMTARARVQGRALGLPDVVTEGACAVVDGLRAAIERGALDPLMAGDVERELDNLLALLAELMRVMPLADAFVSAVSATYPMRTRAHQEVLEADARAVVA